MVAFGHLRRVNFDCSLRRAISGGDLDYLGRTNSLSCYRGALLALYAMRRLGEQ
jgi:hypothetical protein